MLMSLARIGPILVATWPKLLAWFLGGVLVRSAVIAFAAPLAVDSTLLPLLLVPVAVLAQLVSYIGMFLVLRSSMREFAALAEGNVAARSFRDGARDFSEVVLVSIIPFFTLYALLGLLQRDFNDYARSAYRYSAGAGVNVLDLGSGPIVVVVIVVALAARLLLKRFGSRLPRWFGILEIYLEATWVFVALRGITSVFGSVIAWAGGIRIVDWVLDARAWISGLWEPIEAVLRGIEGLIPLLLQLVVLPLAWLLIAGLIYTRSLAGSIEENVLSRRMLIRLRAGAARLPRVLSRQRYLLTDEWDDVGKPLIVAGRSILRAGLLNLAGFMAVYALLFVVGQWGTRLIYLMIGPHSGAWWSGVYPIVLTGVDAVLEPVRIALLAVAFDFCLKRVSRARQQTDTSEAVPGTGQEAAAVLVDPAVAPDDAVPESVSVGAGVPMPAPHPPTSRPPAPHGRTRRSE